jgi:hypothetical protein
MVWLVGNLKVTILGTRIVAALAFKTKAAVWSCSAHKFH